MGFGSRGVLPFLMRDSAYKCTHTSTSYARWGAEIEDTEGRTTMTRLHLDWPSGLSGLPCGLRPRRRPIRVMVEPVAGLMGTGLGVIPIGQRWCGLAAPAFVLQLL